MNRGIFISAAALIALGAQTATAEVVHDAGFGPAGTDARFETVDHRRHSPYGLSFHYRDRDGFYFGYDPRSGRRWYRDLIRQRYYERYYDHRRNRWLHGNRHYRDYCDRHHRHHRHYGHHRHDGYDRGRHAGNRRYESEHRYDRGHDGRNARHRGHDNRGRRDRGH